MFVIQQIHSGKYLTRDAFGYGDLQYARHFPSKPEADRQVFFLRDGFPEDGALDVREIEIVLKDGAA